MNDSIGAVSSGPASGNELLGDGVGNDNGTCEAFETCQLAVTCPAGDLVRNGGYRLVDQGSVVRESYAGLLNEWDVTVVNGPSVDDFVVIAHCINR